MTPDADGTVRRSRRAVLGAAASGALATAGCLGLDGVIGSSGADGDDRTVPGSLPRVEDPPDVVYVPSHREGVEPLGSRTAGDFEVRAMVSYAHPFSIVTGGTVEAVEVGDDEDVHLMVAVRDAETGTVLPIGSGVGTTVRDGAGTLVDDRSPWNMLSQTMGVHFGDNVPLDGDGRYDVSVSIPGLDVRRTGALAGRLGSAETAAFSFTYDQSLRDRLVERIRYTDEADRGVPGAISPMDGAGALPPARDLPGELQGASDASDPDLPRSHDADVAITVDEDRLGDGDPYVLVSPRTPYNRFPIAGTALDATVRRDGEVVAEREELRATVDDVAGFHYGGTLPGIAPGDDLEVAFTATPNVARHRGYETAFLEMDPVEVALEGW